MIARTARLRAFALFTAAACLALSGACSSEEDQDDESTFLPGQRDAGHAVGADGGLAPPPDADVWGPDALLDTDTGLVPALAVAPGGRAMAAWTWQGLDADGQPTAELRWRSLPPDGSDWTGLATLDDGQGSAMLFPLLGADATGGFVAAWLQAGAGSTKLNRVFAALHDGQSWGLPQQVDAHESGATAFGNLRLAVAPNGDALAAWTYGTELRASRLERTTGEWHAAAPVPGEAPEVALGAEGRALLLFKGPGLAGPSALLARTHAAASGWSEPTILDEGEPMALAAAASSESLFAIWSGLDPVTFGSTLQVRALAAGGGWGEPQALQSEGMLLLSDVAVDSRGRLLAASADRDGVVHVSRFSAGSGWSDETLETNTSPAQLRIATGGESLALGWTAATGVFVTRHTGDGWNDAAPVDSRGASGDPRHPALGVAADGATTVVWSEGGGSIRANRWAK